MTWVMEERNAVKWTVVRNKDLSDVVETEKSFDRLALLHRGGTMQIIYFLCPRQVANK